MSKYVFITRVRGQRRNGTTWVSYLESPTLAGARKQRSDLRKPGFIGKTDTLLEASTVRLPLGLWDRDPDRHVSIHDVPAAFGRTFF